MAVGFKLNDVISIDVVDDAKSIIFTTKFVVYELVFDDKDKTKQLIKHLNAFLKDKNTNGKEVETPDFYVNRKMKG